MKLLRRVYDWVLGWAETPYGVPALLLIAFAESAFFPIPPDVLLIALAVAAPTRAFWFAFICFIGSIAGAFLGYAIGYFAWDTIGQPIIDFYHGQATMDWVQKQYDTYGLYGLLIAAITPIPYKVFTIASGVFKFDLLTFAGASIIGRGIRFFAVGALIYRYGAPIKSFIDKNFNLVAIVFTILLVGGFVLLAWLV